jgi:hypothetical protein
LAAFAPRFTFDQSLLQPGSNQLAVAALLDAGVPYSIVYLQSFDLAYQHNYVAENDTLGCRGNGSNTAITVTGFSQPDVQVFDVTATGTPWVVAAAVAPDGAGGYQASFTVPAPGDQFCVARLSAAPPPAALGLWTWAGLRSPTNGADWLVIAPASLASGAQSLAQYRASQGWQAEWVDLDGVYNEFNYGIVDPRAIRAFLGYAYRHWSPPPAYVTLGGRGSYDYKNVLGFGDCLVPPLMMDTGEGLISSDGQLADMTGDGIPVMAIGRLPVLTDDEFNGVVAKIEAYEAGGAWKTNVVMVADIPDAGGNFPADSAAAAALVGTNWGVAEISLSALSIADARTQLFNDLNGGCFLLNYLGHAGLTQLAGGGNPAQGVLLDTDVAALLNAQQAPVMAALSCDLGRFDLPGYPSIGEELTTATNGGTVVVWAPVSATYNFESRQLDLNLFGAVFGQGVARAGDAVLTAFHGISNATPAVVGIYNLLGDPATALGDPASAPVRSIPPPLTYAEWIQTTLAPVLAGGDASSPDANPSGNGVPNLLAYAMDANSDFASGGAAVELLACANNLGTNGTQQFVVLVQQRTDVADLGYVLQTSSNLLTEGWQDNPSFLEIGRQTVSPSFDQVQYVPLSAFDGSDPFFVRLKILLQTP